MKKVFNICLALFYLCLYAYAEDCDFSCTDDQSQVLIGGRIYRCPIEKVCNRLNVTLDGVTCKRCLTLTEMCGNVYTCGEQENEVIMKNETLQCDLYFRCSGPNPTCEPCERIYCNDRYWQCSSDDSTKFTINNVKQECASGFVCNRYAIAPCNACIEQGNYWDVSGPLLYRKAVLPIH